jgi:hypothetical protein
VKRPLAAALAVTIAFGVGGCADPSQADHDAPTLGDVGGGGGCDPNYTGCVPDVGYDLDCADIDGPVQVLGADPHGFDRDGDGIACETYAG